MGGLWQPYCRGEISAESELCQARFPLQEDTALEKHRK